MEETTLYQFLFKQKSKIEECTSKTDKAKTIKNLVLWHRKELMTRYAMIDDIDSFLDKAEEFRNSTQSYGLLITYLDHIIETGDSDINSNVSVVNLVKSMIE